MSSWSQLWSPGAATGIGSMPGTDAAEAVRVVFGEVPDLPFLPELPARGPGAAMLGRTAAMLADLHVDLQPSGWRFVARPGLDERRARDDLSRDLDALEEHAGAHAGPVKLSAAGPWTVAAGLELTRGDKALADAGAVRDVAEGLAEGLATHVADVRRRLPGARLLVQLDEPSLPAVLAGRVPTASGFAALRAVADADAVTHLRTVTAAIAGAGASPLAHCCGGRPPIGVLADAGALAVSVDMSRLTQADDDAIGEALEAGLGLLLGVVPGAASAPADAHMSDAELSDAARTVAPVRALWQRLGFGPDLLAERVALTPSCGLAGASPDYARAALTRCREGGARLAEAPEAR